MNRKLAPELDELMWTLAERRDTAALDEFVERHPHLKGEMGKRLALTNSLRGAYSEARPASIPRFRPSPMPAPMWTRPLALAAATVLLGAFAFGSFVVTRNLANSQEPNGPSLVAPIQLDRPNIDVTPRNKVLPNGDGQLRPNPTPPVENRNLHLPKDLKTVASLEIKGSRFVDALVLIEQAAGITIEMPDLPQDMADMTIDAVYQNMTGIQILEDLGAKHGFTPFHQGGSRVLLIPERPKSELTAETAGNP